MLAETCEGVFIYFYIILVTLDGITVCLNIEKCDGSRCLLLKEKVMIALFHYGSLA
jgi:hypothetical protein